MSRAYISGIRLVDDTVEACISTGIVNDAVIRDIGRAINDTVDCPCRASKINETIHGSGRAAFVNRVVVRVAVPTRDTLGRKMTRRGSSYRIEVHGAI